ncbi:hypothetical protein KKF91_03455, partial [Myxococcota bacterium]|nr:hypothetical protein [Myxococcota bacterium]
MRDKAASIGYKGHLKPTRAEMILYVRNRRRPGLRWWPLRLSLLALPPLLMASLIGGAWLYDHFAQGLPEILTVARYRP